MKRTFLLLTVATLLYSPLFAAGKVYWQANGILITDKNGMTAGSPVPDGQGGVIVFASDGMDSIFAIKIDKDGNLPWTLHGKVLDDDGFGGIQGSPKSVSDGKGGAVAVWSRWYPWGHNLYYNRIDSLGNKVWAGNGIPLTLSDSSQEYHQVVSDGAGGAIAAWQEQRNGQWDIYAQRVDSSGFRQWGDYGKVVCNAGGDQKEAQIACDDSMGAVISWRDWRTTIAQIYLQRVNIVGSCLWLNNGVQLNPTDSLQGACPLISDGNSNILAEWANKSLADVDIYAQKVNLAGQCQWASNIKVCNADSIQGGGGIVTDNAYGVIGCWVDRRYNNYDIYTQRTDSLGNNIWIANGVPICISDSTQWLQKIISDNFSGALIAWQDKRSGNYDIYAQHVDSSGNMKWQTDGMAICTTTYDQVYPEMAPSDSNTAIIIWSDARSGYYRGYAQRVGDDPDGVEGTPTTELQIVNCKLHQNYPNPFKTKTTISYQLATTGQVNLSVYNIAGQLVRTLTPPNPPLEGRDKREGSVTWDGRDNKGRQVSNGVYFYRLRVKEDITKTNKMVKIK